MIKNNCASELNVVLSDIADGIVINLIGLQEVVLDGLAVQSPTEWGQPWHVDSRREQILGNTKGGILRRRVNRRRGQLAIRIAAVVTKADRIGQARAEDVCLFHRKALPAYDKLIQYLVCPVGLCEC